MQFDPNENEREDAPVGFGGHPTTPDEGEATEGDLEEGEDGDRAP